MARDRKASLENKILYRSQSIADQRARVDKWAESKLAAADTPAKKEYWEAHVANSRKQIDEREQAWLVPLQLELQTIIEQELEQG